VENPCWNIKKPMILRMHTSNMESKLSPSPSVALPVYCANWADLEEDGTRIALTVVDTPGFGDQIDNEACFAEVAGYLERQYDDILAEESRIKRNPRFRDNRVHALLYFITPTGHGYVLDAI
jgi:septin family protein